MPMHLFRQTPLLHWWPALLLVPAGAWISHRHAAENAGPTAARTTAEAVLAGGCYWGVESVFRHVRGIRTVTSGYATPASAPRTASPAPVEAVRLEYDPSQISYRQILDVFFSVVHDPTQLDRQGPDVGAEYRSMIFVDGGAQRALVRNYIDSLTAAHAFPKRIVTAVAALQAFNVVDGSQQNYAERHPTSLYIVKYDAPKIVALQQRFPDLFKR
ncbi:MAG TPA: peptide-methionine (S)-S-oxide reductase MsrA [Gemmatimonadaceae bacterium]|nr:peptide-methionine (S)-S-oxide reductase MsrA [Gemmatimonadaceae bacterium]